MKRGTNMRKTHIIYIYKERERSEGNDGIGAGGDYGRNRKKRRKVRREFFSRVKKENE